jgi:hypothetical protein
MEHSAHSTLLAQLFVLLLLLLAGCSPEITTTYGEREGAGAWESVNGTSVLGKMFEQAGHRVSSWGTLSPRLDEKADCIVWFPNDFDPPDKAVCQWLDDWLAEDPDRTLIYVGRDFDAESSYWDHVLPDAPSDQKELVRKRLYDAKDRLTPAKKTPDKKTPDKKTPDKKSRDRKSSGKSEPPKPETCEWFTLNTSKAPREVRSLQGRADWLEGVKAENVEIMLHNRLVPPKTADVLLKSGKDVLVSEEQTEGGRRILVVNGSFLLNLPLVNHEHRKLAAKLIDSLPAPNQRVVFLESSAGGPPIRDDDHVPEPTVWELFNVWPTNWILLHLAIVGVIFCFVRWPIFGRPRDLETSGRSDFGHHIDALADLLQRTHDRTYATQQINNYRQLTGQETTLRRVPATVPDKNAADDRVAAAPNPESRIP